MFPKEFEAAYMAALRPDRGFTEEIFRDHQVIRRIAGDYCEERNQYAEAAVLRGEAPIPMAWCPSGQFRMGPNTKNEYDINNKTLFLSTIEKEQRRLVTLTRGFWVGVTPVTVRQWKDNGGIRAAIRQPSRFAYEKDATPVTHVTRDEAFRFCQELTSREAAAGRIPLGYEYTLPTEAQWEYACRAGTDTIFSFGDTVNDEKLLDQHAWWQGSKPTDECWPQPVCLKLPNPWGLYDVHGNVWEYTRDYYSTNPSGCEIDPLVNSTKKLRDVIVRGGCWVSSCLSIVSGNRMATPDTAFDIFTGFRLALAPTRY